MKAQSLERKLFSNGGGNGTVGLNTFSMSFGEPVVGTDQSSIPYLTRGFHQPIPLVLLKETILGPLEVRERNDRMYLAWHTIINHGATFFEVEYAPKNASFSLLKTLPAQGSADSLQTYGFAPAAPESGYYRIRLQLEEGPSQLSNTVFWQADHQRAWEIRFSDDRQKLLVLGEQSNGGPLELSLWNLAGQQLWSGQGVETGIPIEVDLRALAEGLYLLRVQQAGVMTTFRFRQFKR